MAEWVGDEKVVAGVDSCERHEACGGYPGKVLVDVFPRQQPHCPQVEKGSDVGNQLVEPDLVEDIGETQQQVIPQM